MRAKYSKEGILVSRYTEGSHFVNLLELRYTSCCDHVHGHDGYFTIYAANQNKNEHEFCFKLRKYKKKQTFEIIQHACVKKQGILRSVLSGSYVSEMAKHRWNTKSGRATLSNLSLTSAAFCHF